MSATVSVVLPVFNGAHFIAAAIESILAQQYPALELIVVDDGSTDDTAAIVQRYPVRYVYQQNRGAQHARNYGLSLVTGRVVAFCDSDDVWASKRLEHQLLLLERTGCEIVIGYSRLLDQDVAPFLFLNMGCALIRRGAFEKIGRFDPALPFSDDLDWFMRAREAGIHIVADRRVVLHHRRHENNLTNNLATRNHYNLLMLKKSLARRRQLGIRQLAQLTDFLLEETLE